MTRGHGRVGPTLSHVGGTRIVEAVPAVVLRRVRARFERLDEVALRFARARGEKHRADAHRLKLDPKILLDGTERRYVVVRGHWDAGGGQTFVEAGVRQALPRRVAHALTVGKAGCGHAGISVQRALCATV